MSRHLNHTGKHSERLSPKWGLWMIVLFISSFFINNSVIPADIMESRNIVTAREMVEDGNWLIPTMNGELRLEKPPLPTWTAAFIETIAPDDIAAQRIAAGIMGILLVVYFALTVRLITHQRTSAIISAIVLLTCYPIILMGRTATWDIYCHAFMMAGIYYLLKGLYKTSSHNSKAYWGDFILAGISMGLSFLSKGPVSFFALLLPCLIGILITKRPKMRGKWGALVLMVILVIIIGGWWYAYIYAAHPELTHAVMNKESSAWSGHNVRAWYYYWRFFAETGIWTIPTLASLLVPYWFRKMEHHKAFLFSIAWMIAALVLLSVMPEKKYRYLMPMMMPCSMTVAMLFVHFHHNSLKDKLSLIIFRLNGFITVIIFFAAPVALYIFAFKKGLLPLGAYIAACVLIIIIALYTTKAVVRNKPLLFVWSVSAVFVVAECLLMGTIGKLTSNPDMKSIGAIRHIESLDTIPLYHAMDEELRIELVYETHRKIYPLNLKSGQDVLKALPCAIITQRSVAQEIPQDIIQQIDTVKVGEYDNNRHPKSDRHYNPILHNQVTILKLKNEQH